MRSHRRARQLLHITKNHNQILFLHFLLSLVNFCVYILLTSRRSTSHRSGPATINPSSFPVIPPAVDPALATLMATTIPTIILKLLSFSQVTHSQVSSLLIVGVSHHLFGKIIYFLPTSRKKKNWQQSDYFLKKGYPNVWKSFSFDAPTAANVVLRFVLISLS